MASVRRFLGGVGSALDRLYPRTGYRGNLLGAATGRELNPGIVGGVTALALGYTVMAVPVMRRQMAAGPYTAYARGRYEQERHGRRMFHEYKMGEPTYDTGADGDVALAMWQNRH